MLLNFARINMKLFILKRNLYRFLLTSKDT